MLANGVLWLSGEMTRVGRGLLEGWGWRYDGASGRGESTVADSVSVCFFKKGGRLLPSHPQGLVTPGGNESLTSPASRLLWELGQSNNSSLCF